MEPMVGIEPTTYGLRNRCSTTELHWHRDPAIANRRGRIKPFGNADTYSLTGSKRQANAIKSIERYRDTDLCKSCASPARLFQASLTNRRLVAPPNTCPKRHLTLEEYENTKW